MAGFDKSLFRLYCKMSNIKLSERSYPLLSDEAHEEFLRAFKGCEFNMYHWVNIRSISTDEYNELCKKIGDAVDMPVADFLAVSKYSWARKYHKLADAKA